MKEKWTTGNNVLMAPVVLLVGGGMALFAWMHRPAFLVAMSVLLFAVLAIIVVENRG